MGSPKDVKCNARLEIEDDHGDKTFVMAYLCDLEPGHPGRHHEAFGRAQPEELGMEVEWGRADALQVGSRRGERT